MKRLYPDIAAYQSGYLKTYSHHEIYYEQSGNPDGIPVLYIHGGPGAGLSPNYKCFFDSGRYRIIGFEQRGCGRSRPFGDVEKNTTQDLLEDIELLREQLNINKWVVFGGSWGTLLGLLYAMAHPNAVYGLILRGIFLGRQEDIDWFISADGGGAIYFPEYYQKFIQGVPAPTDTHVILKSFRDAFTSENEVNKLAALKRWYCWEERLSKLVLPMGTGDITNQYPVHLVTSLAMLECHYLFNHCFIEENFIMQNIDKIAHLPATLIHGRYDMICKPSGAYLLHKAWPNSRLQMVPDAGHSTSEPGIGYALCRASRDMARFIREQQ
ncbi:prolyl aminopeptidase [Alteromonas sp. ASW11-130]|uniref:prolyl aminopeptidase n=1 Tax=Alteromonas sp. ASW11-130 TaxID=3015775 RepID=UPI002241C236|nr:prolyl aminopeptidase [Alteromonas sp. ASW11-130]MCW8091933.1 prolyl aminopeptidase [Alteromonas sp. ASW11-130]